MGTLITFVFKIIEGIFRLIFRLMFPKNRKKRKYINSNKTVKFNAGKYKGYPVKDIWIKDNDYCIWFLNSSRYKGWDTASLKIYDELEKLNNGQPIMFFNFGKYKGEAVDEIWYQDNQYCLWLLKQDWAFKYEEVKYMSAVYT